jgi:hypothetical protein
MSNHACREPVGEALRSGPTSDRFLEKPLYELPGAGGAAYARGDLRGLLLNRRRAGSMSRRMPSGRVGLPSWASIQASKAASAAGCKRTMTGVPFPVAGGPRFLRDTTV